jgi:putative restriction endonuclease
MRAAEEPLRSDLDVKGLKGQVLGRTEVLEAREREREVVSGGYEDGQDFGNLIIYTGYGGRDPDTGRQVSDQPFSLWNRALAYSGLNGLPVRVIRGEGHDSPHSPSAGYRYDGLYLVDDYWQDRGRAGFLVWRYRLVKLPDKLDQESDPHPGIGGSEVPSEAFRRETTVLRLVRVIQCSHLYCLDVPRSNHSEPVMLRPN